MLQMHRQDWYCVPTRLVVARLLWQSLCTEMTNQSLYTRQVFDAGNGSVGFSQEVTNIIADRQNAAINNFFISFVVVLF